MKIERKQWVTLLAGSKIQMSVDFDEDGNALKDNVYELKEDACIYLEEDLDVSLSKVIIHL